MRRRIIAVLAAATVLSVPACAGTVQAKTVSTVTNYKKAKKVKTGTTVVRTTSRRGGKYGYVKFTAPKKGKYVFTVGSLKTSAPRSAGGKDIRNGYVEICKADRYGVAPIKLRTQYGKSYSMYVCTQDSWDVSGRKGSPYDSLTSRSMTASMKKGQTLYVRAWFTAEKATYSLKIKRKK